MHTKDTRKIPSPELIFVQKALLLGLFSEGRLNIIGRGFEFENALRLTIKAA